MHYNFFHLVWKKANKTKTTNKTKQMSNNIDMSNTPEYGAGGLPVPLDTYGLRIMEEPKFETSKSSGNPMYVFKLEISKVPSGRDEALIGQIFTYYATLHDGAARLKPLHKALGAPMSFEQHPDTGLPIGIEYKGREVAAKCVSEEAPKMKSDGVTPDLNIVTGKPIMVYKKDIKYFV